MRAICTVENHITIKLQDIDDSNWRECADLHPAKEETNFISSIEYALVEWKCKKPHDSVCIN
jgi:hypothetical protein